MTASEPVGTAFESPWEKMKRERAEDQAGALKHDAAIAAGAYRAAPGRVIAGDGEEVYLPGGKAVCIGRQRYEIAPPKRPRGKTYSAGRSIARIREKQFVGGRPDPVEPRPRGINERMARKIRRRARALAGDNVQQAHLVERRARGEWLQSTARQRGRLFPDLNRPTWTSGVGDEAARFVELERAAGGAMREIAPAHREATGSDT